MTRQFEIWFEDLTLEAQSRLLTSFGLTDAREMNWDEFPITQVVIEDAVEYDYGEEE